MPPPAKPPLKPTPGKVTPAPPATPLQKLEKLASSGYVDPNDASHFISDVKALKPDRVVLRELKLALIRHKSSFDRGAFEKIRTFCETYRCENDID